MMEDRLVLALDEHLAILFVTVCTFPQAFLMLQLVL